MLLLLGKIYNIGGYVIRESFRNVFEMKKWMSKNKKIVNKMNEIIVRRV